MRTEWNRDWVLSGRYSQAKSRVCRALKSQSLEVCFDIDLSGRVRRCVGVRLPNLCVLGVSCPFLLLEGVPSGPVAALFLPLHVAISELQGDTVVSLLSPIALRASGLSPGVAISLHHTIARVVKALEAAGAHPSRAEEALSISMFKPGQTTA